MAEAITGNEKLSSHNRFTVPTRLLIILIVALAIPVVWYSFFRTTPPPSAACEDQYDTLVIQAKTELTHGNRIAAINSLIAARNKLRDCQTPSAKDVTPMWRN